MPTAPSRSALSALGSLLLLGASTGAVHADRRSAEAAMPLDGVNPFFTVTTTTTTASDWEDRIRLPEFALYPNGTILVQKSDERLWSGRLSSEQTLDFMDFLLTEARLPSIDMTYILSSPLTTFRRYALATRSGTHAVRRRASGGVGTGVREGERALNKIDRRLFGLAEFADRPYLAPASFVVSRRVEAETQVPVWTAGEALPFAALVDATELRTRGGAVVGSPELELLARAMAQSPYWRFGGIAAEFRARPALPHELGQPAWHAPGVVASPLPLEPKVPPTPPAPAPAPPPVPPAPAPSVPAPPPPIVTAPPAIPGSATSPPGLPSPAAAPPTVTGTVRLAPMAGDTLNLGTEVGMDSGAAPPTLYVARDAAGWARVHDILLPASGGSGALCAKALATIRASVVSYDWRTGPLLLFVGPATDNYAMETAPMADLLSDGTARIAVTHRHEDRRYVRAPDVELRWVLLRAEGALPATVRLVANGRDVGTAKE